VEHEEDKLEQHSEVVGDHIDEARREWEAKEDDPSVPGAQPDEDATSGNRGSDESAGVPGEHDRTSTGNPDAAGVEHPEEDSAGE
jgi:hypothetical protein